MPTTGLTTALTVRLTFDAAHQNRQHNSKCSNVHGHTYTLDITVTGERRTNDDDPCRGMVHDAGAVKSTVREFITNPWDHAFLARGDEPILETLEAQGRKVVRFGEDTTVENLAVHIMDTIRTQGFNVTRVVLAETPRLRAEVTWQ